MEIYWVFINLGPLFINIILTKLVLCLTKYGPIQEILASGGIAPSNSLTLSQPEIE
jgi:hypothetical protein